MVIQHIARSRARGTVGPKGEGAKGFPLTFVKKQPKKAKNKK